MLDWQTDPGILTDALTAIGERRGAPRQPSTTDGMQVWMHDGRRLTVEVVDKSAEGVGILIPGRQSFEFGPRVQVDFQQGRREATVAHIARREDGAYRVGLRWTTAAESQPR